jgi:hypothetical protein
VVLPGLGGSFGGLGSMAPARCPIPFISRPWRGLERPSTSLEGRCQLLLDSRREVEGQAFAGRWRVAEPGAWEAVLLLGGR